MGATSVTGVGLGAADGSMKGPGNNRNLFVPLLSPHVVAAGRVTLSSNAATVQFPASLNGDKGTFAIMLTCINAGGSYASVNATNNDTSGNFNNFTIHGSGATDVVMYAVINQGYGS